MSYEQLYIKFQHILQIDLAWVQGSLLGLITMAGMEFIVADPVVSKFVALFMALCCGFLYKLGGEFAPAAKIWIKKKLKIK